MKRIIVLSLIVGALTGCPNNSGTPSAPATTTTHAEGDGHDHGERKGHTDGDGHGHDHGEEKAHTEGDGHDHSTEKAGG